MRIWLDADATPRDVKEIIFRAAHRLAVETVVVANQRVPVPPGHPTISAVRVEGGPDVADRYIADHAAAGDLAITADIPLAAILVAAKVVVIDPRGYEHTSETVGERLSVRDFADSLRGAGIETGGPLPYSAKDKQVFASAFDRALTRGVRNRAT
ncbi:MAG TPA: YaiI/YqxD family protein [Gemmatimonadaceae bacterium]|nr:YaiI/YqxD family protein [Gemmatimonadaceae bacterium]